MGNKLSDKKIQKLWEAFQKKQSNGYVVKKCGVSETTVIRYRKKDKWDKRIQKIKDKSNDIADNAAAKRKARLIKVVNIAIDKLSEKIEAGTAQSQSTYRDLDRMIRTLEFLSGEPDSRPDNEYNKLSMDQLMKKFKELTKKIKDGKEK